MPWTYTTPLAADRDWVRFLIRDVDSTRPLLSDEEIDSVIDEQSTTGPARKYYAAAQCLTTLHAQWISGGRGKASKKVEALTVVYGTGSGINVDLALQEKINELRRLGAAKLSPRPMSLRIL